MNALEDVLAPRLGIVFCGTQAGATSAMRRAYYAGRGNKFWSILYEAGFLPSKFEASDYANIRAFGFGLTDIAKATSGPDSALRSSHFDVTEFMNKMGRSSPAFIAFNGKRAAQAVLSEKNLAYGLQPCRIGESLVYVLPSTSGAASGYWSPEPWARLHADWQQWSAAR